ncbi:MAG: hypothetical protein ABIK09_04760 [Pseudomonadota bacterium]
MTDQTTPSPSKDDLAEFEEGLAKKARAIRWVILAVAIVAAVVGGWLWADWSSRQPDEPTDLEKALSGPFVEVQMEWFRSLALTSQYNRSLQMEQSEKLDLAVGRLLNRLEEVAPELKEPMAALLGSLRELDQAAFLLDEGTGPLRERIHAVNDVLADLEPRLYVDPESFQGILDKDYLTAVMLLVYEVLGTEIFTPQTGDEDPVELLVVQRIDTLPPDSSRHGYVRQEDTRAAFILQKNATNFVTEYLLPSMQHPDMAFENLFGDRLPDDLKKPYRALLQLVEIELRTAAGAEDALFEETVELLVDRGKVYGKIEKNAERLGIRLHKPDGLIWPQGLLWKLIEENVAVTKKGQELASRRDLNRLSKIQRTLGDGTHRRVLVAMLDHLVGAVGVHEARHVLDVRQGHTAGDCIRRRVRLRDGDEDFWTEVELEARAYLTQLIEMPEASYMTLLSLLNHLYQRSGNVNFYAGRTLLHSLAYDEEEDDIPDRAWEYLEEVAIRLAAMERDDLKERARALYEDCFGEYVSLSRAAPDRADPGGGCSVTR